MPDEVNVNIEYRELAERYKPLLVLYPEIDYDSERKNHYHPIGQRPGKRPLDQDYHPRDIRLVLDNVYLKNWKGIAPRKEVLKAMDNNSIKYINLIDKGGPKRVDKYWKRYAQIPDKDARDKDGKKEYGRKAYARVIKGDKWFENYISIQYWMAYFFDDWANVHEMDWEMVGIIIKKEPGVVEVPVAGICNAHVGSFLKPWHEVDKANDREERDETGTHMIAYIANGSHAAYFSEYPPYFNVIEPYLRGALRTVLQAANMAMEFTDYIPRYEDGVHLFPGIEVIPEPEEDRNTGRKYWTGEWRWLNFTGKWGSPTELAFHERIIAGIPLVGRLARYFSRPLRESGPGGPNTRGLCWEEPLLWSDLSCFEREDPSQWLHKQRKRE
jgi:hypothetical protein